MSPAERSTEREDMPTSADEYVLGLLSTEEAAAVEAKAAADPSLQADIAAARERFLDLDLHAEPLPVDRALWERIAGAIDRPGVMQPPMGGRQTPPAAISPRAARRRGLWQGAMAAGIAALILAGGAIVGLETLRDPPPPVVVAVLLDPDTQTPGAVVEAFANDRVRVVPLSDIPIPEGRILQVWTLPDQETGPVSLGLMPLAQMTSLRGPDLPRPQARQLYEITLEPAGGSPTGRPTGPILYKGLAEPTR